MLPVLASATTLSRILIVLLATTVLSHAQYAGESCTVGGGPGVCKVLRDCQVVYNLLLSGKPPGKLCGFSGFDPIACCPIDNGVVTNPSRPVTTSTPATRPPTPATRPPTTPKPPPVVIPISANVLKGRIAAEKCAEYAQAVYGWEIPPTLIGNRKPVNVSRCAIKTTKLIVGGKKADPKEFPHMVAIGYRTGNGYSYDCGATLISERFVLTAAHCTYSGQWGRAAIIRVGDLNLARDDDDAKPRNYNIIEWIRHPRYKRPSQYHDIALLKVDNDIEFDAFVRPACLPYAEPDIGIFNKAVATGWGRVEWGDETGSNDLMKVTLELVPQPRCNSTFTDASTRDKLVRGIVGNWQLCAGQVGKDTCQGDSGGPLAIFNEDHKCMYNVIGVTSLGKDCGSVVPGVYTRVYNYLSWIESVVWPNSN